VAARKQLLPLAQGPAAQVCHGTTSEASPQTDECELVILSERSERRISLHQLRKEMLRFAQHDMQNLVSFVKDLLYEDI